MIDIYKLNFKEKNNDDEVILIKVDQACKLLSMGRNTLLKLSKMKGFPALIFPHKIYIDKNQLPIWLSKNYGKYKN